MLVGSGGVVALVTSAWAVMWAVRATPGRAWTEWVSVAIAFVAAMAAFSLLTAQSEVALGAIEFAKATASERDETIETALAYSFRPLLAPLLGAIALGIAIAVVREPVVPKKGATPGRGWIAALVGFGVLLGFGLLDLWLMRRGIERLQRGEEALVAVVPRLQLQVFLGGLAESAVLFAATGIGAWSWWKSRQLPHSNTTAANGARPTRSGSTT